METFGERLRGKRIEKGITVTEMANELGLTPDAVMKIESGKRGKTFEKLPTIAKMMGCRIDDLFPEMDDAPNPEEGKTDSADGFDDDSLDALAL